MRKLLLILAATVLPQPAQANPAAVVVPIVTQAIRSAVISPKNLRVVTKTMFNKKGRPVKVTGMMARIKRNAAWARNHRVAWENGHIVARRFDPKSKITVPMPKQVNHGSWLAMEKWWEKAALDGNKVLFTIKPLWRKGSSKPTAVMVTTKVKYVWSAR